VSSHFTPDAGLGAEDRKGIEDRRAEYARFATRLLASRADRCDRLAKLDDEVVTELAGSGLLGGTVPAKHGGLGLDPLEFGLLCAEVGAWCTATRSVLTVQDMVAAAVLRYGTADQREQWLPGMAAGTVVAGFALTETEAGSDAASMATTIAERADGWALDGHKRWITYGACADIFLVVGQVGGAPTAVLVERGTEGLMVEPVGDRSLGMRASMTAHLSFHDCRIPRRNLLGSVGAGLSFVAGTALDRGRYSVAWGSVGLAEGALRESTRFAGERTQFGAELIEHQLIRRMLTDMLVRARSSRQLCLAAGEARLRNHPDASLETMLAKYAASTAAFENASDAVQIHGSRGCESGTRVERFFRDAKIQQIIEGTDQMHQVQVCELAIRDSRRYAAEAS